MLLAGVLIGYAFIGKGFANLGFPPIYVGKIALLTGGAIFLATGSTGCYVIAALTTLPSLLLAMMTA
jgi:hypothetical protein